MSSRLSAVNCILASHVMAAFSPSVKLLRDGTSRLKALCLFHTEDTPSFTVYKHRFKCFACGAAGTNIDLLVRAGLASTPFDAAKLLAEKFGIPLETKQRHRRKGPSPLPSAHQKRASKTAKVFDEGCTLVQYAEAKKLPVDFLQKLGLSDLSMKGVPTIRIPYWDQDRTEAAVRFRLALTKADGVDDRFRWKSGAKPCLYGLWRLEDAYTAGYRVLVEGESDCHMLWFHRIPTIGIPGAANWKEERDTKHLDGIPVIYVVIEPDGGGETVRKWLATSEIRDRILLVRLEKVKDPSELYLSDPENFKTNWQAALDAAVPWTQVQEEKS